MTITINGNGTVTGVSVGGLPDGIVDTDMIAANAVTAAKSSGSAKGITMAEQWRQTTSVADPSSLTANWAVNDHSAYGSLGSGMSESSGVFTFPSTGIYYIAVDQTFHVTTGGQDRRCEIRIQGTTNNSSYTDIAIGYTNLGVGS